MPEMGNRTVTQENQLLERMEVEASKGLSIRFKLAFAIALLVMLSLSSLAGFILFRAREALIQETTHRGIIIGKGLADYSSSAVLSNDPLNAARFAKDALANDAMVYAVLTGNDDMVLASKYAPEFKDGPSVGESFKAPEGAT